jgi:hypothetical protein
VNTTYRYLAVGDEGAEVRGWFDALEPSPVAVDVERGTWLHFRDAGPVVADAAGHVDIQESPLVSLFSPRRLRGVLWSAGEVHFLTKNLRRRYPGLDRVRRQFETWIRERDLVYDGRPGDWDHFLEGSIRNLDAPVFAFPGAAAALRDGAYFISDDDNEAVLDELCRRLALRGVDCRDESASG